MTGLVMYKGRIERLDRHVCQMNTVASTDDANFTKLTEFAKTHPRIFCDVMEAYSLSPNFRFGDTLLMFCNKVDREARIKYA